jgi:hypothetical protein
MDLILLLCSLAVPSDCVERRIPVTIEAAPSSLCYTGVAVAAIAEAMRAPANASLRMRGWRCVPHDWKDGRI